MWQRLGFINEQRYNWYTAAPDVHRADRDKRFWTGLLRWRPTMPWFEVIQVPPQFAGVDILRGDQGAIPWIRRCRPTRHRIVGIAIKPETLVMRLTPPWPLRLWRLASVGAGAGGRLRRDRCWYAANCGG